jgi:hypothetical protein
MYLFVNDVPLFLLLHVLYFNPLKRHCGLDPQSPERLNVVFAFWRWRMFLRHDVKGKKRGFPVEFVISFRL